MGTFRLRLGRPERWSPRYNRQIVGPLEEATVSGPRAIAWYERIAHRTWKSGGDVAMWRRADTAP